MFDTQQQVFLNPIPVGQMPHQMAMGTDGNTLYVGNTGGESISIVDLNAQQVTGSVVFPPVPRSGTSNGIYPRSLAMGLVGLRIPHVERLAVGGSGEHGAAAAGGSGGAGDAIDMPGVRDDCHAG